MKVLNIVIIGLSLIFLYSCSKDVEPLPSVSHPEGWNSQGADNFHGTKVLTLGAEFCQSCHGKDYSGGDAGVACNDCHADYPHPPTWTTPGNDNSHAAYLKDQYWSMDRCKTCHGNDYSGGLSGVSCYDCHKNPGGPEACNTCHGSSDGSVSDILTWAPPKDLNDNLETTAVGVGAHQNHLKESSLTDAYFRDCNLCHPNITSFDDPLHINGTIDIEFNEVATDSGRITPVWDDNAITCSNTYCHGNFTFRRDESEYPFIYIDSLMTGNNAVVEWTKVGEGEAACGTCHGLPPTGHGYNPDCFQCHRTVVNDAVPPRIINKSLHMNGKIDVF